MASQWDLMLNAAALPTVQMQMQQAMGNAMSNAARQQLTYDAQARVLSGIPVEALALHDPILHRQLVAAAACRAMQYDEPVFAECSRCRDRVQIGRHASVTALAEAEVEHLLATGCLGSLERA